MKPQTETVGGMYFRLHTLIRVPAPHRLTLAFTQQNNVLLWLQQQQTLFPIASSDTFSRPVQFLLSPFPLLPSSLLKTRTFLIFFSLLSPFNYPSLGPCAVSYKVNVDGLCQEVHPALHNDVTFRPPV